MTQSAPAPVPQPPACRLAWQGEHVHATVGDAAPIKVRLVWAKPVTGRGEEIALLDDKKNEVLMLPDLACLDADSRAVAVESLARRYLIPTIARVKSTRAHMGVRYWHIETDLGERRFAMRDPARNVTWLDGGDRALLRDTIGNRYQIVSMRALDEASRRQVIKVL